MYKVASDKRQTVLHRGRPSDWVNGQERLTAEQKRTQAKEGWNIIEARMLACTDPEERKALIVRKREIEAELQEINKEVKREKQEVHWHKESFHDIFIQTAREMLSKVQP